MTIGRWYLRQNDTLAAIGRFKYVVERYQTTSHTPEALYRLVEAYLTLGLLDEAKKDGAVLGYNYPGDAWYSDAYSLLTSKGLRPAVAPGMVSKRSVFHTAYTKDKSAITPPGLDTTAAAMAGAARQSPTRLRPRPSPTRPPRRTPRRRRRRRSTASTSPSRTTSRPPLRGRTPTRRRSRPPLRLTSPCPDWLESSQSG